MNLRTILWVVGLALVTALLAWRSGLGARQLRYYAPDDYVSRADALIRSGYLVADCSSDPTRLVARLDDAPLEDRIWYRDSYLSADVERYNQDPEGFGWAFVIDDDCRLRGVNPVVHAIELPFSDPVRWLGDVLWNGSGSDAVLRSAERSITLRLRDELIPARDLAATRVGSGEDVLNEGAVLFYLGGGRGQPGARLHHVGDEVVVHNRVRSRAPERVRLMGHLLPVGMRLRLESGDWLHLSADSPVAVEETFLYSGGETSLAASFVQRRNERYERQTEDGGLGLVTDPVQDRAYPYLDLVARSVDHGLQALDRKRARELSEGFDVRLTLEREVQLRLSDVFRGYCRRLGRQQNLAEPFAAGMTVMDGRTGKVLALATYPHEEDLGDDPPDDATLRRRLLRNQNLARHPIGSAVKPFLFAAIADAYPPLRGLTIAGHEPERQHREIFHCEVPTGYHLLEGHAEPVDFTTALEISCNKYTVELATLALAADLSADGSVARDPEIEWPLAGRRSGVFLDRRELAWAPDLGGYVFREDGAPREEDTTAAARCVNLDGLEQVRFRAPLESLTGAATYLGRVPGNLPGDATRRQLERSYATNRYDLEPWRPLIAHLSDGVDEETAWKIRAALQEVSPERVNLAFNQITRLRGDFISLLLGGGTSVWSNVQLAEAMSRLVTGREVDAVFVEEVLPRSDASDDDESDDDAESEEAVLPPEIDLDPDARELVLTGLRRVVAGTRGTARQLADELAALRKAFPGDRIEIYSKTGSPVLERSVPGATTIAFERLVIRQRLRLDGGVLTLEVGGRQVRYQPRGHPERSAWLDALTAALVDVGFRTHARRFQPAIRRILDNFEDDRSARRVAPDAFDGPLRIVRGELRLNREDRLFRSRLERSKGAVYVFSVVRVPAGFRGEVASVETLSGEEPRVVTVAIHLDAGPDSEVAVGAAESVLPELVELLR